MSKVIVIGGGPAGAMAAIAAAENGHRVTLLEKNEKLGKKLYITGKGRCNVTNSSDMETLLANVMSNPKFLYSAFYGFTNEQVVEFFESNGLPLKNERGNRVFPVSDHSSDVIACLNRVLRKNQVDVRLHTQVDKVLTREATSSQETKAQAQKIEAYGAVLAGGTIREADHIVRATEGSSYPSTGSTGDGYRFATESGHRMVEPVPSLVPFDTKEEWTRELQGLSLKNVAVEIYDGKKKLYSDFGEMLFTHFGISGPMILSASARIPAKRFEKPLQLVLDMKPALDAETLDVRIRKDFEESINKQFKNALHKLLPAKMEPIVMELSGIDPDKKVNEITKEERLSLGYLIKHLEITILSKRSFKEAIITKGGVSVKDVNPSTMESKKCKNLYFAGEVLDLDAMTGGYNLQIAWSTGYLAGKSIP